jgi:hypothetical protein
MADEQPSDYIISHTVRMAAAGASSSQLEV